MATTNLSPTASPTAPGVGSAAAPGAVRPVIDPALDAFARQAGPDVAIGSGPAIVRVYAIFAVDPQTNRVRVRVVDDTGRLIRMIPPESVAEMLAAMSGYGG